MAESLTVNIQGNPFLDGLSDPAEIVLDWVSSDVGGVSQKIASVYSAAQDAVGGRVKPAKVRGMILGIETAPGLNGDLTTALPTTLYDITLLDAYGLDVMDGTLANRSGTVAEKVVASAGIPVDSELTLTIAAAGDTKKGRMIIHLGKYGEI